MSHPFLHAGDGDHGVGCIRHAVRLRIARDTAILQQYAAKLDRKPGDTVRVSPSTVLWWLAESEDARYLDLFRRYAWATYPEPGVSFVQNFAIYGLARLAAKDTGAARTLRELSASLQDRRRFIRILTFVNDSAVREILRSLPTNGLDSRVTKDLRNVLAAPALPRPGHFPCSADELFGRTSDGAYGCIADTAGAVAVNTYGSGGGRVYADTVGGVSVTASAYGPAFMLWEGYVSFGTYSENSNAPLSAAPPLVEKWCDEAEAIVNAPYRGAKAVLGDTTDSRLTLEALDPGARRPWRLSVDGRSGRSLTQSNGKEMLLTDAEIRRVIGGLRRAAARAATLDVESRGPRALRSSGATSPPADWYDARLPRRGIRVFGREVGEHGDQSP